MVVVKGTSDVAMWGWEEQMTKVEVAASRSLLGTHQPPMLDAVKRQSLSSSEVSQMVR